MRIGDRLTEEQKQRLLALPTVEKKDEVEEEAEEAEQVYAEGNQSRRERYGRKRKETER